MGEKAEPVGVQSLGRADTSTRFPAGDVLSAKFCFSSRTLQKVLPKQILPWQGEARGRNSRQG
jgi:hypothetical protein